MTLKELREKQIKLVADARAKIEEITPETDDARTGEISREYDAMMAEHDRLESVAVRLGKLAAEERKINAPDPRRPLGEDLEDRGGVRGGREDAQAISDEAREKAHMRAFSAYLRYGLDGASVEDRAMAARASDLRGPRRIFEWGRRRRLSGPARLHG